MQCYVLVWVCAYQRDACAAGQEHRTKEWDKLEVNLRCPPAASHWVGACEFEGTSISCLFFFFLLEWQNLVTCNLGTVAEKPLQINRVNVLLHFLFYISILKMRLNWYTGGGLVLFLYVLFVIVDAAVYCHFWICANCNVVFKDRVKEAKHPLIINLYYIVVHN